MARPRSLFKILFYFNFFLVVVAGGGCPSVCSCVGRSTKCSRVHLTAVPRVPARTHTFDLRFNQISEIPPGAFSDLCNLTILLLNDNRLTQLKGGSFSGLPHLKHLYLYRNQIRQIDKDAFRDLDRLEQLYLHVNDIESFSYEVFSGLTRLERLYLHNNKIKHIQPDSFPLLMSLKHLRLDSNPLSCDCGMLWLVNELQLDKKIKAAATCYTPDYMTGRSLQAMTRETFSSCGKPIITKEPEDAVVKSGSDVTFVCEVEGEPQPEIIWLRDSDQLTTDGSRYSIMNNGTLKIQKSDLSDVGFFECLAVNPMGEVKSRSARMVVNDDRLDWPTFIIKPVNQAVQAGEPRTYLHCLTEGKPAPRIQWYHNNRIMLLSDRMHLFHNGTLLIKEVELADAGLYTCHAENIHAIISTSATVNILAPPKFYETPSLKKAVVGERVVFTCKARGYPPPIINWFKDTLAISPTANIVLNDNSQIITIMETSPADEGTYSCHAENSEGFVEASALLEVGDKLGTVAKLVQKPFDVDADLGSSIEMPCMGSGNPLPDVEWRKDGILVLQNKKRKISSFGSLFIYNITALDAGRYECSVVNEYGRDTGSGVLTISDSVLPGDKFVRTAFIQAVEEVDAAIENTIDRLFNHNETNKGDAFQSVRYPKGRARDLARSAEIFERTLVLIRNKVAEGMTVKLDSSFTYNSILSSDHIDLIEQLSGCTAHRTASECNDVCFHNKYRTNDGSCNNIKHPTWGASLTAFRRLMEPRYENGFNLPIGWSKNIKYNGHHLPSAREISTKIISTTEIIADSRVTHMVMQWGQWLDHDLDHALPSVSSQSWDGIDCKKSCEYAAPCFPMDVPPNDPRIHNRRCIDFIRTSAVCGSGMTSVFFNEVQPREQVNQLTSFIDASQVYGFSRELAQDLRDFSSDNGLLRVGPTFPGKKPLLPFAGNQGVDCRRNPLESSINCFVAGDIRANEQISLTAMHTIFMREHNRLVEELREINPFWDGETLYQEARKIVGAEIQFITYEHWLPIIVGPEGLAMLGEYIQYDSNLNPSISNVFATAALRFGHTMINPILHRYDENFEPIQQGHLELHNAFFAPWRLVEEGGVDPLMRGMFMTPAKLKTPTSNLNEELTEKLFHSAHAVALDLAAMNIQRGRDHAIPPYTQWRKFCNMSEVTTFDDLKNEITNADIRRKLKALYGTPQNIDVFVGGILEDQVQGGKVGPLFRCLLVEQFRRLRDGDRFWYENPTTFKPEQMLQIQKTSLARIICDNGDKIDTIGEDVFLLPEFQEGLIDCDDVTSMDMRFWADCQNCNNNDNIETVRARRSIDENPFVTDPLWSEKRLAHLENSYIQFESKVKNLQKRIEILETQCRLN